MRVPWQHQRYERISSILEICYFRLFRRRNPYARYMRIVIFINSLRIETDRVLPREAMPS